MTQYDAYGAMIPMCREHPDRKATVMGEGKGGMCPECYAKDKIEQAREFQRRLQRWAAVVDPDGITDDEEIEAQALSMFGIKRTLAAKPNG